MKFAASTITLCVCTVSAFSSKLRSTGTNFADTTSTAAPFIQNAKSPYSKVELQKIQEDLELRLKSQHDNDAFNALFVSCPERREPIPIIETEGTIPADFPPGCLIRLGPNGAPQSDGFFDGDGMIQSITFPPLKLQSDGTYTGRANSMFAATYIDTKGRMLEQASNGQKKFKGTLGGVPRAYPMIQSIMENAINFRTLQAQKDTCNTAIAESGGRILALMEQCPPTEIEITKNGQIKTVEACTTLNGTIDTSTPITGGSLSAHGRTCPATGDRVHVSYRSDEKPYLRMDVFGLGWDLKESRGIDIPTPIFLHDSVMTENYVVVMDLPLTLRTTHIIKDRFPVEYEPDHPARIGLVPRNNSGNNADDENILWFDCEPGVVLHASNAWETDDGETVIIQGFRGEPTPKECYLQQFSPSYFYEYSIDLATGKVTEKNLNSEYVVEFPVVNEKFHGRKCSSSYCLKAASIGGPLQVFQQPKEGVTFDSVLKFAAIDTPGCDKGDVMARFVLPARWFFVSEPTVLPKIGKAGEGEYVLLIATHCPEGLNWEQVAADYDASPLQSKVFLLDGDDLDKGPVYTATLPFHIPYGLHSGFVDWEHMK